MEALMPYLQLKGNDVWFFVHVQPGAKTSGWSGEYGERIKVRLNAPPIDGKANAALTGWLAEQFGFSARDVAIIKGETSRTKTVCLSGCGPFYEQIKRVIQQAL